MTDLRHDPDERRYYEAAVDETVALVRDTGITNDQLQIQVRQRFKTDELVHLTDMFERLSEACFTVARERQRKQEAGLAPVPMTVVAGGSLEDAS